MNRLSWLKISFRFLVPPCYILDSADDGRVSPSVEGTQPGGICFGEGCAFGEENPVEKKLTWLWREASFQGAEIHLCAMRPGHTQGTDEASGFRCYRMRPLNVCPNEMLL